MWATQDWAGDAKEYLRDGVLNKRVEVNVEYKADDVDHVTIIETQSKVTHTLVQDTHGHAHTYTRSRHARTRTHLHSFKTRTDTHTHI